MRENKSEYSSIPYDLRYTSGRRRDSPSSSILKSPTALFIKSRNSSTRRLKFANGPDGDELASEVREGSHDSASTSTSIGELPDILKGNYDNNTYEEKLVEVSLSPVDRMKVSPDSWNAFLEYQKYKDHSNETEKTDYTYSRLSKYCDREIIPGFRIRPNLSRKPIHGMSTAEIYSSSWSPEVNYCVKKTVYECSSPSRSNIDDYDTFGRSELYKNEMTDYTRHDEYFSDNALRNHEKYQSYSRFGSDGRVLLRRKGFGFNDLSADKHSTLETSWGYDDTVDDGTAAPTLRGKSYSNRGRVMVFLTAVFAAMSRGITSTVSLFKDLFSRYILRRKVYPYNYYSSGTRFGPQSVYYSYGNYGTKRGRLSNWWYQSFLYALYSKVMSMVSKSGGYVRNKYYQSSRKGRFLWFLIPFLFLLGFCILLKDLFPNPDAILKMISNTLSVIGATIAFVFLVFFPRILFESIPYLVKDGLPYFFTEVIPFCFWSVVDFICNSSLGSVLNALTNPLIYTAEFMVDVLNQIYSLSYDYLFLFYSYFCIYMYEIPGIFTYASTGVQYLLDSVQRFWLMRAEREDAFVSNKVTEFKCKANQYLSPARNQVKSVWKEMSDYSERIFGQSLEPVRYIFRGLFNAALVLIQWMLSVIWSILGTLLTMIGALKDLCAHFLTIFGNIFSDAVEKKDVISRELYNFFSGVLYAILKTASTVLHGLGDMFWDTFQFLKYLIPFYWMSHENKGVVNMQSGKVDFTGIGADWESLKKRIEDLEMELKKVKEEKSTGDVQYQKQLEDNYKSFQKYQVIMNEALRRQSLKPAQLSKTFVQYYLGNATEELKKWILAHFVLKTDSKDIDENTLEMLMAKYSNKSGEELKSLQNEFARFVRQYSAELSSIKTDLNVAQYQDMSGNDLSLSLIKRIVTDEIKLHDADKTGKVDYALQSAGGQVLGVKCTKNFHHCFKYSSIFGFHVCAHKRKNAPEEAINPGMAPGQCWAFAGSQGFLTLELSHSIIVTGFTMEHISRMLSPNGRIESAPKTFSMWGLKTEFDMEPYLFGEYEYKDNNETYQYFPVFNYSPQPYKIVELNIVSNHGNPNYTCLYRIRVHGEIYPSHL